MSNNAKVVVSSLLPALIAGIPLSTWFVDRFGTQTESWLSQVPWIAWFPVAVSLMVIPQLWSGYNQLRTEKRREQALELFSTVEQRLSPILDRTLNEHLSRRQPEIKEEFNLSTLELFVFFWIGRRWVVVASTRPQSEPVWDLSLADEEGVVGYTAVNLAAFFTEIDPDGVGHIYNVHGDAMTGDTSLTPENRNRVAPGLKHIFSAPLGQRYGSAAQRMPLGVLTADSYSDEGKLMKDSESFTGKISSLGQSLVPYLEVKQEVLRTGNESGDV